MAPTEQNFSFEYRLSQQLEALSTLSETLILRLLLVEERVKELESKNSFLDSQSEKMFSESKDRLENLQCLLELLPNKDELKNLELLEDKTVSASSEEKSDFEEAEYLDDPQIPLLST